VPITYTVDHHRQRITATASGTVTVADVASYVAARVKDGVYDYDQVIDLLEAHLELLTQDTMGVIRQARVHLGKKPIPYTAVVARAGTANYGVARQLATLFDFEGASVHLAESVPQAHAWLDEVRSEEGRLARENGNA
jgi:hypothetical protein